MSLFAEPRVSRDAENLSKETAKDWCQLNSNDECCQPGDLSICGIGHGKCFEIDVMS